MMNTYSMQIGVFGNTREQYVKKMKEIQSLLKEEDIDRVCASSFQYSIKMKDGTIYLGILASEYARGYKWQQVYVPHDIDTKSFNNVIYPTLYYSDLPEDEQIIYH
jgi:hypothetical protein